LYKPLDGRDWEKLGLALVGRALLSKAVIQLSADGWGFDPSLLFGLRQHCPGVYRLYGRVNGDLQEGLCQGGAFPDCYCQCLHPRGEPLATHASTGDPSTPAGSFGLVSCGVRAPFL